jgi:hypothetical protein
MQYFLDQQTSTQFVALNDSVLYPFRQAITLLDGLVLPATELASQRAARCLHNPTKANGNAASGRTNSNTRPNALFPYTTD